jgi:hypothetical protein
VEPAAAQREVSFAPRQQMSVGSVQYSDVPPVLCRQYSDVAVSA